MKTLTDFILEAAAPKFTNNKDGIASFCDYVLNDKCKYTIDSDNCIIIDTQVAPNGVANIFIDTKDLKEIPDFIVFKNIEYAGLELSSSSKIKTWAPKVIGGVKSIFVDDNKKLQYLDLSQCDINGGILHLSKTNVEDVIGGNGKDVQLRIVNNSKLKNLDLSKFNGYAHGSHISKNRNLVVNKAMVPKKQNGKEFFNIEKNAGGYETAGSTTKWDKE